MWCSLWPDINIGVLRVCRKSVPIPLTLKIILINKAYYCDYWVVLYFSLTISWGFRNRLHFINDPSVFQDILVALHMWGSLKAADKNAYFAIIIKIWELLQVRNCIDRGWHKIMLEKLTRAPHKSVKIWIYSLDYARSCGWSGWGILIQRCLLTSIGIPIINIPPLMAFKYL